MVDDGRCPLCARAVPGLPGSEAPCVRCGVWVKIPFDDAPVPKREAPAAPVVSTPKVVAATSLAKPVAQPPVVVPAPSRRSSKLMRWAAVFAALVLLGGALGAQAYFNLPPAPKKLEKRLVGWDASGDGGAYQIFGYEEGFGETDNRFERIVHLDGDEFLLTNRFLIFHQRGDEYYITYASDYRAPRGADEFQSPNREPTVGRSVDPDPPFEPMPAKILNRTGRHYIGILGSHPFTLDVDEEGRFQTLNYQNHRGDDVRLHYDYEGVKFPAFVRSSDGGATEVPKKDANEVVYSSLPRNAANFPQPDRGVIKARVPIQWVQDLRPASDFLIRFTNAEGELMAETAMDTVALPGGFSFAWDDRNGNGLVDEGDSYSYQHPKGLTMTFYDVWARQPVGSPRREGPWDPQWDLVTPSWRLYNLKQSS